MNDYLQYVHNLKGQSRYDRFRHRTRETIISLLLRQIEDRNTLEKAIIKETSPAVLNYISSFLDLKTQYSNTILTTETSSYVEEVDFNDIQSIVNLKKINNTQHPNKLFRAVNKLLPMGGLYIARCETDAERKYYFYKKYGKFIGQGFWIGDFLINRVLPRIRWFDRMYYKATKGVLHSISFPELLGRLVYCGFRIIDFKSVEGETYFIVRKRMAPMEQRNSSYYPIISLPRIGKDGRLMKVYKIRTMHPYSEYIQDFMAMKHGYDENGRPARDYRIARWGRGLRNLWLDELPQLIQVLKGEMKLVGVRPLSPCRFNEFPPDLKASRIKHKPGCIPPYVALNMPSDKARIEAERIYLESYSHHPRSTDMRYFLMALRNIVLNRIRNR